jgi:hypothetical protein
VATSGTKPYNLRLLALLFPLAAILQSTLLWEGLSGGVTPDVCLLLTLFCGLAGGAAAGSAAGLWAGALVGALRAAGSLPLAVIYGLAGWLAGLHRERSSEIWTYPLVGMCLITLVSALEVQLSKLTGGTQPPLSWLLPTLGWHFLFCLSFLGVRR